MFRVAQEALSNIARHARASHVRVQLSLARNWLTLAIYDDGAGFDTAQPASGMGLANMRARSRILWNFELTSSPGGTHVTIAMPVIPAFNAAQSNRLLFGYAATGAAQLVIGIWQRSPIFILAGLVWGLYCVHIAAVRAAARRRAEGVR